MAKALASILFVDLEKATDLLERVGQDPAQRALEAYRRLLGRCVTAHGGHEVTWLGDGLMAVFDSPADAARCAVAMQRAAARRVVGERLTLRIGLDAGDCLRLERGYAGTPVVVARQLCTMAGGGRILCHARVPGLLAGQPAFSFRDCAPVPSDAASASVAACELLHGQDPPTALLARTPFVGRRRELERLQARLRASGAGSGGLVLLRGEPGIGKTRTLEEFGESARLDGALVLSGRCDEGAAARPYGPFVDALTEYVQEEPPDVLREELGSGAAPLARLIPALRECLPDVPEPAALRPDEQRVRILDAVAQWLIAMCARVPVLLVVDDLHWADAATVALLRHVARFATRHRLLLVGAFRDVEVAADHPLSDALGALPRETACEHIALAGLDEHAVGQLLDEVADQKVPEALVSAITAESSGNPFFIREILLYLVEEGKIVHRDGRWTSHLSVAEMGIPQSVRQVIERRLARLSEPTRRLLRNAAAFSGSFPFALVARVANMTVADGLDAVDEALAAQLLRPAEDADAFDFTHALVRHTLYAEMSPPRQARLHRRIAEVLARQHAARGDHRAGEIARHYHRSLSLPGAERGVPYAVAAADRARDSAAFADEVAALRIALALLPAEDGRRPRLLARLALALAWSMSLDEAVAVATEAAELLAQSEGADAAADFLADAADATWMAAFSPRAWSIAEIGLRYAGARRDTTWARLMVYDIERRQADDPEFPGIPIDSPERQAVTARLWELSTRNVTQTMLAFMAFRSRDEVLARAGDDPLALVLWAGEFRRALPILEQATATALARGQIAAACFSLAIASRAHCQLGDLDASAQAYAQAVALYERVGEIPWLKLQLEGALAVQVFLRGEDMAALLAGMEAILAENARENRWSRAIISSAAAYASAVLGRTDAALAYLESVIPAIDRAPGAAVNYPMTMAGIVRALEELGRSVHTEVVERNFRTKWLGPDFRYPIADSRHMLGILCALTG